jgi:hypothetical protein
VILLLVSVWGYSLISDWMQRRTWMNTSAQVSRFTQAVKSYTGRYYDTLLASATTTAPVIVTPAMLKNTGFLEQGFSETTIDGQAYSAAVIRNATNTDQLQAMIYTQNGSARRFSRCVRYQWISCRHAGATSGRPVSPPVQWGAGLFLSHSLVSAARRGILPHC